MIRQKKPSSSLQWRGLCCLHKFDIRKCQHRQWYYQRCPADHPTDQRSTAVSFRYDGTPPATAFLNKNACCRQQCDTYYQNQPHSPRPLWTFLEKICINLDIRYYTTFLGVSQGGSVRQTILLLDQFFTFIAIHTVIFTCRISFSACAYPRILIFILICKSFTSHSVLYWSVLFTWFQYFGYNDVDYGYYNKNIICGYPFNTPFYTTV